MRRLRCALPLVLICSGFLTAAPVPVKAGHGDPHAQIKYWNIGDDPVIIGYDPHETVEDIEGVTTHVATPSAPLTLATSMENGRGGYCGPLFWNPVTNDFKIYPVTGGFQAAIDVNREAPAVPGPGGATFRPGDAWMTVYGNAGYGNYVNFRGSDNFRRYTNITGSALGIRVNQSSGKIYSAAFDDGAITELNPANNAVRKWTIGNKPYWLDIDDSGNVYTAAAAAGGFPDQVVRVNPATGEVRRWDIPGGGLQPNQSFGMPNGVRVDQEGNVWFTQTTADKVARLRVAANAIDQYGKAGIDDPNGIASSGAGSSLQAFFSERAASQISLITPTGMTPTTTTVPPAVSAVTPASLTAAYEDFVIQPFRNTIPPQVFDSPGIDPPGIVRFPSPSGVSGPAGISNVAAPGTIYGSYEGSDHVFGIFSSAIIAPPGSCAEGPEISVSATRPVPGRVYEDDVDVGPSGSSAIVVRGSPLTVNAVSSNPANTAAVQFLLDGSLLATDTTVPYSGVVPMLASPGPHAITVRAIQADKPNCVATAEVPVEIQCFGVDLAIDKPALGAVYLNDAVVGASGGDPISLGGNLTAIATSSNPARTSLVEWRLDAGVPVPDAVGNPYTAVYDTNPLSPGLHLLRATLYERNPSCTTVVTRNLRRPDTSVKGVALGVFASGNVPAEPIVIAGGAEIGRGGGTDFERIVDQPLPPVLDYAHAVTDQSRGSVAGPVFAESDSLITDVSLLGGLIRADVLHAKVRADLNVATVTSTSSSAGTEIVNLVVNGVPTSVSQPNTTIPIPGVGYVILQETITSGVGARAEITVNMVHAFVDTSWFKGEVILGSAFAGVNLAGDEFAGPESDLIHRIDDAGTDTDAGSDASTAIPIAPGIISGALTPGDDSDFYSFPSAQGERILGILKPAEREIVRQRPVPPAPPTLTPADIVAYGVAVIDSVSLEGPFLPNFDLYLYDATGAERTASHLPASVPDRAELNADRPYDPPGAKETWTLEVRRATDSVDGFYSLDLSLLPEPLMDQNDAGVPGDASDTCSGARALPPTQTNPQEIDEYAFTGVIRDDDQSDFYSVNAQIGQLLTVVLKPDEADDGADFDLFLYGPRTPGGVQDCLAPITQSTNGGEPAKALPDAVVQLPVLVTGTYGIEVRRINAVANYYTSVSVVNPLPTIPDNDAGTAADAGDVCAAATPLGGSGAYEGRLPDLPDIDNEDWYSVSLQAVQDLTVVMKPSELSNFDLELYRPDCTPQPADQYTVNHLPLSAPETVHVADAGAGAWKLKVKRVSGGGNYLLGVAVTP